MKKVLAIAPYRYLPSFSGGQKFIAGFFDHLAQYSDLTVISVPGNEYSLVKNYRTIPLLKASRSRYSDRSLFKKIKHIIEEGKFESIIWEHPYYAWLAVKLKKSTGIKTFIHTHNIEYQRFRSMGKWWWPILRRYEKWCFKNADRIMFITPEDKSFAIGEWKIPVKKCIDLPFGLDIRSQPTDRGTCREELFAKYNLHADVNILFFNGLLDYKPNLDALKIILEKINPRLIQENFRYRILIAGKNLPAEFDSLKSWSDKNIIYTGFLGDIDRYYKASDLFLNPVQGGGGIKTKMVESIAYGTTVIATESGAWGIDRSVCGEKLIVVKDDDWNSFSESIIRYANIKSPTPDNYYEKYAWDNIIIRVVQELT